MTAEDVNELFRYYQDGAKDGGFEGGVRSAVTGMLASPFFLYRGERIPAGVRPGDTYAISDLELASNLSFFLWNTIPDDELLQLGHRGQAETARGARPAGAAHAGRSAVRDAGQQLRAPVARHEAARRDRARLRGAPVCVRPLRSARRPPHGADALRRQRVPGGPQRRRSAAREATFLNERVALHYGITEVKGDRFRRVELKQSARWGLLGKGAVLMAAAYPNRTSPVLRGAFILKHIQGVPPANPPPNVPTLDEKDIGTTKALTVREMNVCG